MKPATTALACALLALHPGTGTRADSALAPPRQLALAGSAGQASAHLHLRVQVPERLLWHANRHPELLPGGALGWDAEQALEVQTNLPQGFCVQLRLRADSPVSEWRLQAADSVASVQASEAGYRVCVRAPGRHTLALRHRFGGPAQAVQRPLLWPVETLLSAL